MSTTNTPNEATKQNSIVNSLIGQVSERLSSNAERVQSDLDLDEIFLLLNNSRRRAIIRLLSDVKGGVALSELTEQIAAAEEDLDRSDLSKEARKRVYVSCYQCHLPKLEKYDVVSVDGDQNVVIPSGNHSALMAVLNKVSAMVQ